MNELFIRLESFPNAHIVKGSFDGDNGGEVRSDKASEKAEIPVREVNARAENWLINGGV